MSTQTNTNHGYVKKWNQDSPVCCANRFSFAVLTDNAFYEKSKKHCVLTTATILVECKRNQ